MKSKRKASAAGHQAHTKDASTKALAGRFDRPVKVTMLGAGSGFTPRLMNDIMLTPGHAGGVIALVDIDPARLRTMAALVRKIAARLGQSAKWKVEAFADRRRALRGTDYLINCIEVSGVECVRHDYEIPARYGVDQCIGDTIGPGGLFKALRTIPVWLDVLRDAERLCPGALVLNYTNPMNMLCLAAGRTSPMQVVGLCHSVQGTGHLLAKRAGVPYDEMEWQCAGINHLAWFTRLRHRGTDLYPQLMRKAKADLAGRPADPNDAADLVRKDMMVHFGAFITESSGHLSEYLPYYRKRQDLVERYCRPGYDGESAFYANNWPNWRKSADESRRRMLAGKQEFTFPRSWEYASWIIEAREKGRPFSIHGNVMNCAGGAGPLISNLPADGCVEVACMVDRTGVHPVRFGALPPQMAAVSSSNMPSFDLGATAAIERSIEAAVHSLLLDPLTSSVCSPAEIKRMALELFAAQKDYLPGYR
jgi:alpha-galactosidase